MVNGDEVGVELILISRSEGGGDSDTLMAARSQPNDNWGSVGNSAKHGEKHVGGGSGM